MTRPCAVAGEALTTALAEQSRSVSATSLTSASTVAEVSSWWLQNIAAVRVRPSSLGKYVDRVERITAHLGDVRIGSLRVEQIARWQATLLESLSPKTVADTRATLRSVVAEAVNLDLVSTNPVDRVRPPKARAASKRALTAAEARALVSAGARDRLGAAIALLFVAGLAGVGGARPRLGRPRPRCRHGDRVAVSPAPIGSA